MHGGINLRGACAGAVVVAAIVLGQTLPLLAQPAGGAKKFAFLVGVEDYHHPSLRALKYSSDDVTELATALSTAGYEVRLLTAETGAKNAGLVPTRANIESQLKSLLRDCGPQDLVLIGFAGHGLQFAGQPDAYFCPVDARPFVDETASLVSMTGIYSELEKSFAGVKILLVDACRDDPNPSRGRGIDADSAPPPPRGVAALFSCSAGQKAYESDALKHGVFFHHVLGGLQGRAADPVSGEVTFDQLSSYVRSQVPRDVAKLVPNEKQYPNLKADLIGVPPVLARVTLSSQPAPLPIIPPVQSGVEKQSVTGMRLKLISRGEFWMGASDEEIDRILESNASLTRKSFSYEQPRHHVVLTKPFFMGVYEVTQQEYAQVMGTQPSKFAADGMNKDKVRGLNTDRFPAEGMTWFDALEFCNKLSEKDRYTPYYVLRNVVRYPQSNAIKSADVSIVRGNGYRLPTEAQWEYACRAGTSTYFHFGDESNGQQSNVLGNHPFMSATEGPVLQRTCEVGKYAPNAFGLFDMHGNVMEMCYDGYLMDAYKERGPVNQDPLVSGYGSRVLRGGGFSGAANLSRAACRMSTLPGTSNEAQGFRVVLPVE